jgi:hypothetical protein
MQDEMGGACRMCGIINPEEKRPLGKPERRFGCNIKMDFKTVVCEDVYLVKMGYSGGMLRTR